MIWFLRLNFKLILGYDFRIPSVKTINEIWIIFGWKFRKGNDFAFRERDVHFYFYALVQIRQFCQVRGDPIFKHPYETGFDESDLFVSMTLKSVEICIETVVE